jgi:hypothetical protein
MTDKGKGAENLIWLASRQTGRANPSSLAADDILAALTGRIAELEARVSAVLAEVEPELPSAGSKQGPAPSSAKAEAGRGADRIGDARVDADAELNRASEERRMLANEMRLLREAFQEARRSQPLADPGAKPPQAQVTPDLRAAIADEMRSLLTELLADFRTRPSVPPVAAPAPVAAAPTVDLVAAAPPIEVVSVEPVIAAEIVDPLVHETPEAFVEDVEIVSPPVDLITEKAPPSPIESIVEHVDELIKPAPRDEFIEYDEFVDDLPMPEPVARLDAPPIIESTPDLTGTIEDIELEAAPPELAAPIVAEPVFEAAEPAAPILDERLEAIRWTEPLMPVETVDLGAAPAEPAEPIVEYVDDLLEREVLPPVETIEVTAPVEPPEMIVEERTEDLAPPEPIVEEYVAPSAVSFTPPVAPPPVDPRIEAMWDTAPSPPSFVPEEFVAEARPVEFDVAPSAPPLDVTPEPPVVFAPEPPVVFAPEPPTFAPEPPMQFAIEPPVVFEPEAEMRTDPPLVMPPQPESPYVPIFPELRVSDDRGLHQIQVVIAPIHSFPRLLETERRIRALSTVNALHLRDFRNGVATLTVSVSEAISPAEFGAVIQMLEDLHLRLEGTSLSSVELRAEDESPTD